MTLPAIGRAEADRLLDLGGLLVDIREDEDRACAHIAGSLHAPLSELPRRIGGRGVPAVIFYCETGLETAAQGQRLARVAGSPAFALQGGLEGWRRSAEPAPARVARTMDLRRQFLVTVALILLALTLLGTFVSPYFVVGNVALATGLATGGVTGRCRLLAALRALPWNRNVVGLA